MKTIKESNVEIAVDDHHESPERSKVFYNPRMKLNRELVLCALTAFLSDRDKDCEPPRCLDAFGATGVTGLQWVTHHGPKVDITICDQKSEAVTSIQNNCQLNGVKVKGDNDESTSGVEVICEDVNVLLHRRAFDFVHLDPFGCTVPYLDATFRNISNHGILSISSTDTSALYNKCDRVTLRQYDALLCRTEYMKETAVRLVVAAAVRAAARCNKGVEVLVSTATEHFVLVILRVRRGPTKADACMQQLKRLMHCQMCLERTFVTPKLLVTDNPYKLLPCECNQSTPGDTAACIGPLWSGSIFNVRFLQRMTTAAKQHSLSKAGKELLQVICHEARCSRVETSPSTSESPSQELCTQKVVTVNSGVRTASCLSRTEGKDDCTDVSVVDGIDQEQVAKRQKMDPPKDRCTSIQSDREPRTSNNTTEHLEEENGERLLRREETLHSKEPCDTSGSHDQEPAFFFNIHNYSVKESNSPKLNDLITHLQQSGFRASRTHFERYGVRTSASKAEFTAALSKCSPPTRK